MTSNSDLNEVLFSGSSGVSTPLSQGRRSSLTFSPKRNVAEVTTSASNDENKKASFVTKTTVFLDQSAEPVERVKFDSTSLPTSPTSEDGPSFSSSGGGILKRKGSMGSNRQPPRQDETVAPR